MKVAIFLKLLAVGIFPFCLADSNSFCPIRPPNYNREKGLLFDFYPAQMLTLTKGAMQKTKLVKDNMECMLACMKVPWCRSVNFKIAPRANGLHACQLLSSEQSTGKLLMKPSKTYNHYSVKNPCQERPCRNGGKCIFEENRQSNNCECKQGFVGEQCESGKNCDEILRKGGTQSGTYWVNPDGQSYFKVYCDQKTVGGGWTVFQKRKDGSLDFYREWNDYKNGFGDLKGEFWLGLDKIHSLTSQTRHQLRVELTDANGKTGYAEYEYFAVSNELDKYKLSLGTYLSDSTVVDSLSYHNGMAFSTKDRDNDKENGPFAEGHCARYYKGAWWHKHCWLSNLNGVSMKWNYWKNSSQPLKGTELKIKPA